MLTSVEQGTFLSPAAWLSYENIQTHHVKGVNGAAFDKPAAVHNLCDLAPQS
jgi:hypothetical protein